MDYISYSVTIILSSESLYENSKPNYLAIFTNASSSGDEEL
jgi:hypothetical protein